LAAQETCCAGDESYLCHIVDVMRWGFTAPRAATQRSVDITTSDSSDAFRTHKHYGTITQVIADGNAAQRDFRICSRLAILFAI
jgi:hypothetical protein